MKLLKAECPKNIIIEFQDNGNNIAICPKYCPIKQRGNCYNRYFNYRHILSSNVKADVCYIAEDNNQELLNNDFNMEENEKDSLRDSFQTTIAYNNPFEEISTEENSTNVLKNNNDNDATISKYNATISPNSIFKDVIISNNNEPCFIDGKYKFYYNKNDDLENSGNAQDAIRYIFRHWYTSRVFTPNGKKYCDDFLLLLKICNYQQYENELEELLNMQLNVNQKFFKLFYSILYKNQLSSFYWSEKENPFHEIIPKFNSKKDFIRKLLQSDNENFFQEMNSYLNELLYYLQSFNKDAEINKKWLLDNIPLLIAEYGKEIAYLEDINGTIKIIKVGKIDDFIKQYAKMESYEKLKNKFEFLTKFKILPNGSIIKRDLPLRIDDNNSDDDSIYSLIGITGSSSIYASYYNYYINIIKEYINVFHPNQIVIGGINFNKNNFYDTILNIVNNGYASMFESKDFKNARAKMWLVKSLFEHKVLEYFESYCETTKLSKIKALLKNEFDISEYFSCDEFNHKIYKNNEEYTLSKYIEIVLNEALNRNLPISESIFKSSSAIESYFKARINEKLIEEAKRNIKNAISESEKIINKFIKNNK